MSGLFSWSTTQFDKLFEKATSHLLLEPDWDAILQICDCIRQDDVQPKYVVSCIKKKLYAQNPHVVLYTLQVLESCVKNCGAPIHGEIATRPFMEELREVLKNTSNDNVKSKILELIQAWAYAFRNEPKYRAVQDMFSLLRVEGYKFQAVKESDAMFVADTAPEWADEDCCYRCRVQFTVLLRRHHCRNCGHAFCNQCSSRNSPIPRFGIEKEVRVCEACWETIKKPASALKSSAESSPKQNAKAPSTTGNSGGKTDQELKEEEELQLALALSQSEAESKERSQTKSVKSPVHAVYSSSVETEVVEPVKKGILASSDSELDRYLNRSYWEQRQQQKEEPQPRIVPSETRTSPVPSAPISAPLTNSNKMSEKYQNGDVDEMSDFLTNLKTSLEIFVNRMKSNSSRGRPIATDTYVQSQFMNITNMHSQLLKYIQEQEDSRAYYESLQDKLNQIRDARAALDDLREEHREKLRREAEEAERIRQIQMAQKLEIMRKKKHEYLQYQRQLAIQRIQEQEREMQMRHEQQKQQYHQVVHQGGTMHSSPYPPQPYMPPATQGYRGMPSADSSGGMPLPHGPQPYPAPFRQAPPPTGNGMPAQHMQVGDYRQPYNMQAMGAAMPAVPQGALYPQQQQPPPHAVPPTSVGPVVTSAQNAMMHVMPQHMMGPGIAPHMMAQNMQPAVTNVPSSIPQVAGGGIMVHQMQAVGPPMTEHTQLVQEKETEPLIVFD